MKKQVAIAVFLCLFFLVGCGSEPNTLTSLNPKVNVIKEGSFDTYPDIKIGDAYAAFFENPQWNYFENKDGVRVIEFSGSCMYREVEVKAKQQFILNKMDDGFQIGALSFNDVPQETQISDGLIQKVFQSYREELVIGKIKKNLYGQWEHSLTGKKITLNEGNIRILTDSSPPISDMPSRAILSIKGTQSGLETFWVAFKEDGNDERALRVNMSKDQNGNQILMMDILRNNGTLLRSEEYVKSK